MFVYMYVTAATGRQSNRSKKINNNSSVLCRTVLVLETEYHCLYCHPFTGHSVANSASEKQLSGTGWGRIQIQENMTECTNSTKWFVYEISPIYWLFKQTRETSGVRAECTTFGSDSKQGQQDKRRISDCTEHEHTINQLAAFTANPQRNFQ